MLTLLLAPTWSSCENHPTPTAPNTSTTTTSIPSPTVTRVSLSSGTVALTTIGQTAQLTLTATFSDNTTRDVSSAASWQTGDARVVTVSSSGLLTVAGFGATFLSATYQNHGAGASVTATPPGTFVISGRVREPGAGGLANLSVVDTLSGRSVMTNADGDFSLAELPSLHAHFKAEKAGYEPAEVDATQANVDLPIQRVVRLTAGDTATPDALAPNDLVYTVGGHSCNPCRLIRVVVVQPGTLHVHVTWTLLTSLLSLFVEGQVVAGAVAGTTRAVTADVTIDGPREVVMYLGAVPPAVLAGHTPFTVETSIR